MRSENAFKEMPTLADKSSDFGFSSGIQVYFWMQRSSLMGLSIMGQIDLCTRLLPRKLRQDA